MTANYNEKLKEIRPNTIKQCLVTKHFTVCLLLFDRVSSRLITFEGHQTFDQNLKTCLVVKRVWSCLIKFEGHQNPKTFLLFSCLMGDVLFVWTALYQTCLMRACVPRLLSGLYQLFDLCLIKHVLTVWSLTSTLACLVTKQCLMVFGPQTFLVCPGPYSSAGRSEGISKTVEADPKPAEISSEEHFR